MSSKRFMRIVTNSDLDALVSAVLLKRVVETGAIKFLPLEELRQGRFEVSPVDIVVNLPYIPGCHLWFDHHASNSVPDEFGGLYNPEAPSAARVIYDYYCARGRGESFSGLEKLLLETDRVDSARFRPDDIISPDGAVLLSFLIDSNPFENFSVSENLLMINLLDSGEPETVINHPVFKPPVKRFLGRLKESRELISSVLWREDNLLVLDCRKLASEKLRLCNNKFMPFVLEPDADVLLRIKKHSEKKLRIGLGFNMFLPNERHKIDYGALLARYGGGGHPRAAGCAIDRRDFKQVLSELKTALID